MKPGRPEAILIAGPNGAGKTTFARQFLRDWNPGMQFLNADEIQRKGGRFRQPIAAGRELLARLSRCEARHQSFAIETTLSSRRYARRLIAWRDLGYRTTLHFIALPSVVLALRRVAGRVAAGGHFVPDDDVLRRFARGISLFWTTYKALPDSWYYWRSDENGLRLVDRGVRPSAG